MKVDNQISFRERIRLNLVAAMRAAEISQVQLAEKLGISKGTVNNWTRGNNSPDVDMVPQICEVLGIPIIDFYSNGYESSSGLRQKTPPISDEAMKLAKDYDDLDHWGQKQVRSTADIEAARVADERRRGRQGEAIKNNVTYIPFQCSVQPASAGTGTYLGPEAFEIIHVRENDLTRRAAFGVPVQGDSMEPRYHNGDILIVEGAEEIEPGEIGIFTVDGEGYVKELGEGELISLNPKYDPIPINDSIRCHGRVIGILDPEWIEK
ncbi:MAG: LexA family transcriptional regulator [Angelakisella sp.]|nr:LexA family transcriptional regulator [Angelakisella sp.]